MRLTAEAVQGATLAFQGVDDVHGCDGLPLGVLGVGDGITDDVLQEYLQDTTGLFVDQARDTLYSSTTRQTTDCGLGDALDVITQHLPVTLGATLSESLSSLSAARHVYSSASDRLMPIRRRFRPSYGAARLLTPATRTDAAENAAMGSGCVQGR